MKRKNYFLILCVMGMMLCFTGNGVAVAAGFIDQTPIDSRFDKEMANDSVKEKGFLDKVGDWASKRWNSFTDWCAEKWKKITEFISGILDKLGKAINSMRIAIFALVLSAATATVVWWNKNTRSVSNRPRNTGQVNPERPYGELADRKTTDQQMAIMSQLAYEDGLTTTDVQDRLGADWQLGPKMDTPNSMQGVMFYNEKTKEVIIAYRGTQEGKDLFTDLVLVYSYINPQTGPAIKFAEQVMNDPQFAGYKISATGHSLGGNLANKVAMKYFIPTVTFNAPGDYIEATPGGRRYGFHPLPGDTIPNPKSSDSDERKAVLNHAKGMYKGVSRNYVYEDDTVGNLGTKPGETLIIRNNIVSPPKPSLSGMVPSLSDHGIGKFTGYSYEKTKPEMPKRTEFPSVENKLKTMMPEIERVEIETAVTSMYEKNNGNIVPR
ncbi:Protein of unknown function [Thermoactinomyces sp. DSM 45891]|uniref:Mbeg1-like protein n=1 Tax=Thermoactinomyces sp. DSM 45891 TaxID=1761907 RepID=UPI0009131CD8|nr:Mbeg1-like protein [Thermoactinomyces sp. DSM 45891]SFX62374.1 Protein of unknown function [Thermoactinomyces sp. DSM 45891]